MIEIIIDIILVVLIFLMIIVFSKIIVDLERKQFKKWAKDNKYEFILSKYSEYEEENKLWNQTSWGAWLILEIK